MLKFGQEVDLDALNSYTVNKSAEELREKVLVTLLLTEVEATPHPPPPLARVSLR
jgi:hypothetical protein